MQSPVIKCLLPRDADCFALRPAPKVVNLFHAQQSFAGKDAYEKGFVSWHGHELKFPAFYECANRYIKCAGFFL